MAQSKRQERSVVSEAVATGDSADAPVIDEAPLARSIDHVPEGFEGGGLQRLAKIVHDR